MKKIVSLLCSFAIVFSMLPVTAFAAEPEEVGQEEVVVEAVAEEATSDDAPVGPMRPQGLWYEENQTIYASQVDNMTVQPDSGTSLRMWLKNTDGPVRIVVGYTNWLGFWVGMSDTTYQPGERDVELVSSCNGSRYQVKLSTTDLYATYSVLLYQN